jgi:hypothetical protein
MQRHNKAQEEMTEVPTPEAVQAEWMKAFMAGNLSGKLRVATRSQE